MGTNFYAELNKCECCGRSELVHLGKRSAGWTFSFQGSETVRNFDQWCTLVRSASAIHDEYQTPYTADEMIKEAREWNSGKRHTDYYPSNENWLDENGYSFSGYDFS